MSKRVLLSAIVVALVLGVTLGYYRGAPNDFVEAPDTSVDYGYRCGDGSEFTIVPSEDMASLMIVPATSADYVPQTVLNRIATDVFEGAGVTFTAHDVSAELGTTEHGTTTCASMNPPKTTLFHH
jgi:hypothetical protein